LRIARGLLRTLTIGVVVVGIAAPAAAAFADPSLSQIEQQITQKSADLEKIDEQYNKVTEQLQASQAAVTQLDVQMAPLQTKLDAAQAAVEQIAIEAYKGGPMMGTANALLSAGTPDGLMDELNSLDQIGRKRSQEIASYRSANAQYTGKKAELNNAVSAQTSQQAQLTAQKNQYDSDLQNLYALRKKAYGSATQTPKPSTAKAPAVSGKAGVAVSFAYAQLGKPYVFAAAGPGSYDCSGLTMAAWKAAGVSLSHNAAEQWGQVTHISRSSLAAGDLVFYSGLGHVGIYVGGGQIIHAPHAGTVVQLASVDMETPYGYGRP
jgi:cell wall-associated NlpC family hydrolase